MSVREYGRKSSTKITPVVKLFFQPSSLDILGGARTSAQAQGLYTNHTCAQTKIIKTSRAKVHTHVRAKSYV